MVEVLIQENQRRLHIQLQALLSVEHFHSILSRLQQCPELQIKVTREAGQVLDLAFDLEGFCGDVLNLEHHLQHGKSREVVSRAKRK